MYLPVRQVFAITPTLHCRPSMLPPVNNTAASPSMLAAPGRLMQLTGAHPTWRMRAPLEAPLKELKQSPVA